MTFNQFVLNNYNADEIAEFIKTGFLEVIQKCGMDGCEPMHYRPGPNAPNDWQMGDYFVGSALTLVAVATASAIGYGLYLFERHRMERNESLRLRAERWNSLFIQESTTRRPSIKQL